MSTATLQVSKLDNSASGLRYGLLDVEPFEETKIVKKFGVKYRQTIRGLKPTKSFSDFIKFNTAAVLGSFQLPEELDQDKISEVIAEKRIKDYESDTELTKLLDHIEKVRSQRSTGHVLKEIVQFFLDRRKSALDSIFEGYAKVFMNSDFPMSLIADFTDFEATYLAALELLQAMARKHSVLMSLPELKSDFTKYRKAFDRMKFALSPIIEQMEISSFKEQSLRWYMILSNTKDTSSIFEGGFLSKAKVDEEELKRLEWEFQTESAALRKLVMGADTSYFKPLTEDNELKSTFDEMVIALTS